MARVSALGARRPRAGRRQDTRVIALAARSAGQRVVATAIARPLLVSGALLACGVLIHTFGAYSDIVELYKRDALWLHRLPYFDYPLEYPVLLGGLMWLTALVPLPPGPLPYFYLTAALLGGLGLLVVHLGRQFAGADRAVLALSPALGLYVALNWDMAGVVLLVAALLALRRGNDGWGGVLLAAATWLKFFPIVLVPLVLIDRIARRRWTEAWRFAVGYGAASVVINAPVALQRTPEGWVLRDGWRYFFRFHQARPLELNLWNLFDGLGWSGARITTASGLLLILGLGVLAALLWRARANGAADDLLVPAALAALGWWFFVNKVYSPQYSLWLVVLLALAAPPRRLALAFAAVDIWYFIVSFTVHLPWNRHVLIPAMIVREVVILAVVCWAMGQLIVPRHVPLARMATRARRSYRAYA